MKIGALLLLVSLSLCFWSLSVAYGQHRLTPSPTSKTKAYDIYLTEGRLCRRCMAQQAADNRVRLIDRNGLQTTVPASEIVGIDRHPIVRKLLMHSLQGIGNAGPLIVPDAFENARDYACKYCPTD